MSYSVFSSQAKSKYVISFYLIFTNYYNYYYYYYYSLEFFTSASADGLSLEIMWEQVSSSLQDSSQYSGRFQ